MAAVVSFTTGFVLLIVLVVASPFPTTTSAARNPLQHYSDYQDKSPDNIGTELQKTLNTLSSVLNQLINPEGDCNLEDTTVRLINNVITSVKKLGSFLCENEGSVTDVVIPYVIELQDVVSQFKPLMDSLPTESVGTVSNTLTTMDTQIASYVPNMIATMNIHI